ncbi:NUDIX hydrolase [Vibrio mangrovi]|uniref:Bifunctional nicotinamide mononucleotide adenylyltransferase/ADP-ribose pyrophosphatase n=1 Tax=Vibrio mangrovi TaxID=474394 RepID=A0A1Y6IZ80_9VIBR|nr:NUDIX hydrolase [Vibrio mangrovi]MDW6005114.1 NUDIX hydrolase [Vibrio mangrovi]SMS02964.1 bifunctional nicotinamide mononucleotide adenylyltransferase/ADP-ribose pyrophosphatase [Vibrio mangrovi]
MNPWIDWVKQLQAISQAGLTYSKDKFDIERFQQLGDISHQMFSHLSDAPVEQISAVFFPESGYPTPKIDLRAAVIQDGKILLVREREDDCWTMPGGWGDVCETPKQGVVREVEEESGFIVASPRLYAVKDRAVHPYQPLFPFHIYKMFFLCELIDGEATENIEISEIDFFSPHNLPPLSESRVLAQDIHMAFDAWENGISEVYID